jgi:hypothetical protein
MLMLQLLYVGTRYRNDLERVIIAPNSRVLILTCPVDPCTGQQIPSSETFRSGVALHRQLQRGGSHADTLSGWSHLPSTRTFRCVVIRILGREHTKETGNRNATAISEKSHRFQAGDWFPD